MIRIEALVASIAPLSRTDLEGWLAAGLVTAAEDAGAPAFDEPQCARVRLLCTLAYDLELGADALPVALSLLDQLYETRRRLAALSAAVAAQGPEIEAAVLAALDRGRGS